MLLWLCFPISHPCPRVLVYSLSFCFLTAQVAGAEQVMFFKAAALLLQQSQGLSVDLFVPKRSSVAAVLWQISAAWKRDKDAGSWIYLSGLKKTCFFTTAIGTELIWCSGVLLLPGIFFLETVWKLQGDSAIAWKFLPMCICFWSSKRKTCFCAVIVKIKQGRHKGLVYSFWGGEHVMQCNISGVVFCFVFFFYMSKTSLVSFLLGL